MPNIMIIGGRPMDLQPTRRGVRWEGGGRPVAVATSITGTLIRTQGHRTPRYLNFDSPEEYVISAEDAAHLQALADAGDPFELIVPDGYDETGTWPACLFDGQPVFPRSVDPRYRGYRFRLSLA